MKVIEYFKPSEFGAWIFMDLAQSSPEDGLSEKWLGGEGGGRREVWKGGGGRMEQWGLQEMYECSDYF